MWMPPVSVASRFRNAANRRCFTLRNLPNASRRNWNLGPQYADSCLLAPFLARMPCPAGAGSSATLASPFTAARRAPSGCAAMNNPLRILQALDRHLTGPAEITLFGRAALALG